VKLITQYFKDLPVSEEMHLPTEKCFPEFIFIFIYQYFTVVWSPFKSQY